jgi:hypothetical protein
MKKENKTEECCSEVINKKDCCGGHHGHHGYRNYSCSNSNAIYGLGVVGALFYFLGNATSFTMVMIGIGKAIFWPAILMFELLTFLGL